MSKYESAPKKQPYQKAVLKSFSLVADEVMAGTGCKGISSNPTVAPGGLAPCAAQGCSATNGS